MKTFHATTYYKRLICLKYTGKKLGLLEQSFRSYLHIGISNIFKDTQNHLNTDWSCKVYGQATDWLVRSAD